MQKPPILLIDNASNYAIISVAARSKSNDRAATQSVHFGPIAQFANILLIGLRDISKCAMDYEW